MQLQLSKIVIFGLVGLSAASPVKDINKRSATTIENDITNLTNELATLATDISSFSGGLLQELALATVFNTLEEDLTTATSAITSTGTLSLSDSATVVEDATTLTNEITTTATALLAQVGTIQSLGLSSTVVSALQTIASDASSFYTALEGVVNSAYVSEVQTLATTTNDTLYSVIAAL